MARLIADNWHNQGSQLLNDNINTNNKLVSVNLVKFELSDKISFANIVRNVYKKWLRGDYLISNKINLIISIITNWRTAMINHLKKFLVICPCQISKIDQSDENNIGEISNETVYNWERMIRKSGKLLEIKVNVANTE